MAFLFLQMALIRRHTVDRQLVPKQITRFHASSLYPSSFHLQQAGRIFHRAQQLRDPRPLVSRCLLLPFTLEVNSSSWQATFIALLVLRGDNHHVRSLALGKKWGSGDREAKRGWGSGRTTGPSSHNAEESSPDRASPPAELGGRGGTARPLLHGEESGSFNEELGPEVDRGKPHPSQPLAPRERVFACDPQRPQKAAAYSPRFSSGFRHRLHRGPLPPPSPPSFLPRTLAPLRLLTWPPMTGNGSISIP